MFYSAPWLVLIKGLIMNNKLWKRDKSPKDIAESLTNLKKGISYSCLSYKLRCYTRISTPDKTGTTHVQKIRYFFTCVWYSQSNADTSLAFSATWSRWWVNSKAFAIFNPVFCRNFLGLWLLKHSKIRIAYRQWRSNFPWRGRKPIYEKKNRKLAILWPWRWHLSRPRTKIDK